MRAIRGRVPVLPACWKLPMLFAGNSKGGNFHQGLAISTAPPTHHGSNSQHGDAAAGPSRMLMLSPGWRKGGMVPSSELMRVGGMKTSTEAFWCVPGRRDLTTLWDKDGDSAAQLSRGALEQLHAEHEDGDIHSLNAG